MIKKYEQFMILEKFDSNIKKELIDMGITDEKEIKKLVGIAKHGHLAEYFAENGSSFTFGVLNAIFLDALAAKQKNDLRVGVIKMAHRLLPIALAPFFPILAIVGLLLGTSRAFNKVIAPILADPGHDYPAFLRKLVVTTMKVAEGEVSLEDRFSIAFVVSDRLVDALKPDVVHKFSIQLSAKMAIKNKSDVVPEHYIENELKEYLNKEYQIDPKIPVKY